MSWETVAYLVAAGLVVLACVLGAVADLYHWHTERREREQ